MRRDRRKTLGAAIVGVAAIIALAPVGHDALGQTAAAERGKAVYDHWCAPCHAPGPGHPGTQGLEIKYRGALPAALEEREDLTPELVRTFVRQGILSMAPFRKTEVTDAQLDDIAAYLSE